MNFEYANCWYTQMDESTYHTSHGLGNENAKRNAYTQQSTVPIMTMHATNMAMQTPNMTVQAPMEIEYGSSSKAGMQTLMSRPQMSHYYSSSFPQYSNARTTLHNNGFARTNSRGSQMVCACVSLSLSPYKDCTKSMSLNLWFLSAGPRSYEGTC